MEKSETQPQTITGRTMTEITQCTVLVPKTQNNAGKQGRSPKLPGIHVSVQKHR